MAVMGTILFGFYAALVAVFSQVLSLPIVVAGTLVFVAIQYKLGKYLAIRSVNGRDLDETEYEWVHDRLDRLADEMDIPRPRLMVGDMGVPNAFAVGRQGASVVVVSETLIELLDRDELEGVLAHECAHVKNRDVLVMLIGQSIASMIGIAVFWVIAIAEDSIVGALVGWIVSVLVQMLVSVFVLAISRYREYIADSDAVAATGNQRALGRALTKIAIVGHSEEAPDVGDGVGALCIFGGKRGLLDILFGSHPPIEKRIERIAPAVLAEAKQDERFANAIGE